jgi:hypothetical protein
MLELHIARDKATRLALATGQMTDMTMVHAMQRHEGNEPCFGRAQSQCEHAHCRWHGDCMTLATFVPTAIQAPTQRALGNRPRSQTVAALGLERTPTSRAKGIPKPTGPATQCST